MLVDPASTVEYDIIGGGVGKSIGSGAESWGLERKDIFLKDLVGLCVEVIVEDLNAADNAKISDGALDVKVFSEDVKGVPLFESELLPSE